MIMFMYAVCGNYSEIGFESKLTQTKAMLYLLVLVGLLSTSTSESLSMAFAAAPGSASQFTTSLRSPVIPMTSFVPYLAKLDDLHAVILSAALQLVARMNFR